LSAFAESSTFRSDNHFNFKPLLAWLSFGYYTAGAKGWVRQSLFVLAAPDALNGVGEAVCEATVK